MIAEFREATRDDVPAVLDLLRDDVLGAGREGGNVDYFGAFDAIKVTTATEFEREHERLIDTRVFGVGADDHAEVADRSRKTCRFALGGEGAYVDLCGLGVDVESLRAAKEVVEHTAATKGGIA